MNPIIYAKFNKDFRRPIQLFLRCHCRDVNERLRAEQFAEQFGAGVGSSGAVNELSASRLRLNGEKVSTQRVLSAVDNVNSIVLELIVKAIREVRTRDPLGTKEIEF